MLKWALFVLALTVGFALAPVSTASVAGANDKVRVFIDIPGGYTQTDGAAISALGGETRNVFATSQSISVELPATAVQQLTRLNRFFNVRPVPTMEAIDDTLGWIWGVDQIDAERVWGGAEDALNVVSGNPSGAGVKVAIVDTGIDRDHPDLAANIIGGRNWSSNGQTVDNSGNCNSTAIDAANYEDEHGHGTHVAGTVAAIDSAVNAASNSVIGVAPNASLLVLRTLDKCGSGYMDDIAAAVEWASGLNGGTKADIISMSLGCFYAPNPSACDDPVLRNAVNAAYNTYGVLVVVAAGNSGPASGNGSTVGYPAMYDGAIAVGSTTSSNSRSSFSSTGAKVEIAAPGSSITSTYLNGQYATMSGTSMATPHVAGVAALVKSANPSMTASQIRTRLQQTATDLGDPGRDVEFGYGLVDAVDAAATGGTTPLPPAPDTTNVYLPCTSSASTSGGDGNGYESSAASACADDSSFAGDTNSGTSTSTSCTNSGKDRHILSNFGITLPASQLVAGIEVRLDAWADSSSSSPSICVELSSDGNSWTAAQRTSNLGSSQATYTLGTPSNLWGRTWNANDVANLRVRLTNVSSSSSRDFRLDYVAVKVSTVAAPTPVFDLAVTGVTANPTSPVAGSNVDVTVNVANEGNQNTANVALTLTDSVSGSTIGTQQVSVDAGQSMSANFTWDSTGAALGAHNLVATLATLQGETDTADNSGSAGVTVVAPLVDLAITSVTANPATLTVGGSTSITAAVTNQGNQNVSNAQVVFTDGAIGPVLGSQTFNLNAGQSTNVSLSWNTTGATANGHTVVATLGAIASETDTTDNSGSVLVTVQAIPPGPKSSGYVGCTGNAAVTSGSGDNNGFQSNAASACADDSSFATDDNSGSGTSTSCTNSGKDRHVFFGYAPQVPDGATVDGIQVRLDAWADSSSSSPRLCVQISTDGGSTWTTAKQTGNIGSSQNTYVLGSTSDKWGRTWTATDANNIRIRVTTTSSSTSRDFRLDFAGVQVTYTTQ